MVGELLAVGVSLLLRRELTQAAENRPKRLFIKNIGVCKVVRDDV